MAPPREALHKFTASPLALPLTLALLLAAGLTALAYPLYRSDPDFRLLQPPKGNRAACRPPARESQNPPARGHGTRRDGIRAPGSA